MKKFLCSLLLVLSVAVPILFSNVSKSEAATAPQLTKVQITAITSNGNNMVWENIAINQLKANSSLKGDTLYLKVRFTGYDKGFLANSNGVNVYPYVSKYQSIPITSGNIVVGWDYYFSVPMNSLPSNTIQISGINHLLGNIVYGNPISFNRE